MIIQERLQAAFQQFGWVRIPETLHSHAEEVANLNLTYLEFLDKLLQEELAAKHDRYLRTRTRLAKLPYHKTIVNLISNFSHLSMSVGFGIWLH